MLSFLNAYASRQNKPGHILFPGCYVLGDIYCLTIAEEMRQKIRELTGNCPEEARGFNIIITKEQSFILKNMDTLMRSVTAHFSVMERSNMAKLNSFTLWTHIHSQLSSYSHPLVLSFKQLVFLVEPFFRTINYFTHEAGVNYANSMCASFLSIKHICSQVNICVQYARATTK